MSGLGVIWARLATPSSHRQGVEWVDDFVFWTVALQIPCAADWRPSALCASGPLPHAQWLCEEWEELCCRSAIVSLRRLVSCGSPAPGSISTLCAGWRELGAHTAGVGPAKLEKQLDCLDSWLAAEEITLLELDGVRARVLPLPPMQR